MKKYLSLFLAVCLLCGMLVMPVSAATTTQLNAADALYSLGLFLGTNKGYELNNSLTREQSAMLLVRMLGALETAETGDYTHPFTDVAPWASKVVAYAYANEYVKGYSATKYGGADTVTDFQYLTIVLRVLGYTDGGENPDFYYRTSRGLAKKIGLVDNVEDDASFTRGDAVEIFWRALNTKLKDSDKTLADRLIDQKVFDAKAFAKATGYSETGNPESEGREENKKPDTSDNTNNSGNNGSTDNSGNNGSNGGSTTPPSGKLEDTTWEQYLAMSADEQLAFFQKFSNPADFFTWKEKAEAEYEKNQNVIEVGADGTVDLGQILGKN